MTDFFTTPDGEGPAPSARIITVPEKPEDPTGWEHTPPPTTEDEQHVLFDTEQVNAAGLYAQYFQNSNLTTTGTPKVFGVDTNMRSGGAMTEGCEKDMHEVRLVSSDLPPDTEFVLNFMRGATQWFSRRVRLGEWVSLQTHELRESVDGKIETDAKPLTIVSGEGFSIHSRMIGASPLSETDKRLDAALLTLKRELHGIDDGAINGVQDKITSLRNNRVFQVRAEVRGAYRRPDYASKEYWVWRSQKALSDIHRRGIGGMARANALFDIDFMRNGTVRLFSSMRMNLNGKQKEFGVDYNLVGHGGAMPRGWTKQVCMIELETDVEGALEVRLLLSGYEWLKTLAQEGGGNTRFITLHDPLTLIEGEHFALEVKAPSLAERAEVRATLHGPLFSPSQG